MIEKSLYTGVISLLLTINNIAQPPSIQWQKCYGGSLTDRARAIRETSDGGYIVASNSLSNDGNISAPIGMQDYWIVKLNTTGELTFL